MSCSVIIPTYRGAKFLPFGFRSLAKQSYKDFRAIYVVKPSGDGTEELVKRTCGELEINNRVVIQESGCITHALNLGTKHARGDIVLFTDDDVILPADWIEKHLQIHSRMEEIGAVSGNITYYDPDSRRYFRTEIDRPLVNIYRRLVRPVLEIPHRYFKRFRHGVYITTDYKVAAGSYIPRRFCLSLPCRGANMSFKSEAIKHASFPEHPVLRVAPSNEQFIGAQIVMQGWKSIYTPDVLVYHIARESLSRGKKPRQLKLELSVMQDMLRQLLEA
ncbi:glycosyltransferase, partial [Candidatus Bathyarchaeota archaeon]|nr:glycosyltransferase [Candidatus Bathyarchaeota archaeon]